MVAFLPRGCFAAHQGDAAEVVHRKGAAPGSLDGWGWREFKALPVSWFDGLARILSKMEDSGVWPEGLLDAKIAMFPMADVDATFWVSGLLVFFRLLIVLGPLLGCCSWRVGFHLVSLVLSFVLAVVAVLLRLGILLLLILRRCSLGLLTLMFIFLLPMSLNLLIRWIGGILDKVLNSLGLPAWFRHAYFEYNSHVRLRFKLAAGLGQPWTRDGCMPSLYLPWCGYLAAQEVVKPQLYAGNLKCVSRDPGALLRAAWFTVGYVRLVGQEPARSKCVLMSTSRAVRSDMRRWVVTDEGDRWSVKLDVRDLGEASRFYLSGLVCYLGC